MISFMPSGAKTYGMEVSKLQSGVRADSDGVLHGTLHYVKGFSGFSSAPDEQNGNYLAMNIQPRIKGTTKFKSSTGAEKTLPEDDNVLVWRVKDNNATMTIRTEGEGETGETVLKASGLTLEAEG